MIMIFEKITLDDFTNYEPTQHLKETTDRFDHDKLFWRHDVDGAAFNRASGRVKIVFFWSKYHNYE